MKYTRIFKNPIVREEMVFLRLHGWSLEDLAYKYDCQKVSVRRACIREKIPVIVDLRERPILIFRAVKTDWNGERLNPGKSYKEYLKEEKQRHSISKT